MLGLAAGDRRCRPPRRAAAARRREASKPGPASTPMASARPGWPASRDASSSVRKIAVCCPTAWRGRATPTTVTVRAAVGGREAQPRAQRGAVAGDDLAGSGGRAAGAEDVRRQRGAAPAVGDGVAAAEPGGHRDVGDRGADAGDGRQPSGERGVHAGALAERDVVVDADDLLPRHDGGRAGVALDGRMGAQGGLERHAAGHHERGGSGERHEGAGEGAEAAAGAEESETKHRSVAQVRQLLGDLVGVGSVEHPDDLPVGEEDDAVGVGRRHGVVRDHHDRVAVARRRPRAGARARLARCGCRAPRWARRRTRPRAG